MGHNKKTERQQWRFNQNISRGRDRESQEK